MPAVWKMANIMPLPKTKIVQDPKKDLRPISLTAFLRLLRNSGVTEGCPGVK